MHLRPIAAGNELPRADSRGGPAVIYDVLMIRPVADVLGTAVLVALGSTINVGCHSRAESSGARGGSTSTALGRAPASSPPSDAGERIEIAPAPPASSGIAPVVTSCQELERRFDEALRELDRNAARRCSRAQDCDCWGGPRCPNPLVSTCPDAIRADVARSLEPWDAEWKRLGCVGYLWSPYGCDARCVNGMCNGMSGGR